MHDFLPRKQSAKQGNLAVERANKLSACGSRLTLTGLLLIFRVLGMVCSQHFTCLGFFPRTSDKFQLWIILQNIRPRVLKIDKIFESKKSLRLCQSHEEPKDMSQVSMVILGKILEQRRLLGKSFQNLNKGCVLFNNNLPVLVDQL